MQGTTQSPLHPPYPHAAYAPPIDQRPPHSAGAQPGMPGHHPMGQAVAQTTVEPTPHNGRKGNYEYTLVIDQQPIRARMCGFGDKDRRPITPPPCVRIVITDLTTGREVPAVELDPTYFLLSVDLWDEHAHVEKNIVRASSNSPAVSISTATTTSFPPPPDRPHFTTGQQMQMYSPYGAPAPGYPYAQPGLSHSGIYPYAGGYYAGGYPAPYAGQPGSPAYNPHQYATHAVPYSSTTGTQSTGMFTRNLIGSLAVNAFALNDPEGRKGHWFVLQDLSIRTEGSFRLKFSFIDIGTHASPTGRDDNKITNGKAEILATVFSQPFQVYSAKKFPGVIESTALSKCFASQGIKIPIRKDGMKGGEKDEDEE